MSMTNWTQDDSAKAQAILAECQQRHDLSSRKGQTAGIDPVSGRIWFGDSMEDVVAQRDADGCDAPLYFERIGSSTYYRKGACR